MIRHDITNRTESLMNYILRNNPSFDTNQIIDIKAISDYDLIVKYFDGSEVLYDTYNNTSRLLNNKFNRETEYERLANEFKDRLNIIMERKNITQYELAKRLNTTQPMVSRYLTGQSIPNAITFKRLANELGCSTEDFFYDHL